MKPDVPLEQLNITELLFILSRPSYGYLHLRRDVDKARLIHLIETHEPPLPQELSDTMTSRKVLQEGLHKMWIHVESQLPCKGKPKYGWCTIFSCTDGRHVDCYESARRVRLVTK